MAIDPLNPKPLKRVIRRNPKTKATDKPLAPEQHRSWSMKSNPKNPPAKESWWTNYATMSRQDFQWEARIRHPNAVRGLNLKLLTDG